MARMHQAAWHLRCIKHLVCIIVITNNLLYTLLALPLVVFLIKLLTQRCRVQWVYLIVMHANAAAVVVGFVPLIRICKCTASHLQSSHFLLWLSFVAWAHRTHTATRLAMLPMNTYHVHWMKVLVAWHAVNSWFSELLSRGPALVLNFELWQCKLRERGAGDIKHAHDTCFGRLTLDQLPSWNYVQSECFV